MAAGCQRVGRLPAVALERLHAELVGRFPIARAGSQAQQAQALLACAEALSTEQQQVTVERLGVAVSEVGHARELPLHPLPGSRLLDQPGPAQQLPGHAVTAAGPSGGPEKRPRRSTHSKKPVRGKRLAPWLMTSELRNGRPERASSDARCSRAAVRVVIAGVGSCRRSISAR